MPFTTLLTGKESLTQPTAECTLYYSKASLDIGLIYLAVTMLTKPPPKPKISLMHLRTLSSSEPISRQLWARVDCVTLSALEARRPIPHMLPCMSSINSKDGECFLNNALYIDSMCAT